MPSAILVPLLCALAFPVAASALKRASDASRDVWGMAFASNVAVALAFLPFLFPLPGVPEGCGWWEPVAAGAVFCIGQAAAFKSFQGVLSIAIPMQGAKVLIVGLLASAAMDQKLGYRFWIAATLSVAAIHLLNDPAKSEGKRKRWATVGWAFLASAAFAAFDVAVQAWSPAWGVRGFSGVAFASQAGFSLLFLPAPPRRRFRYAPNEWGWVALGSGLMAAITVGLVLVIGGSGKAALVNLIFNSRCVSSVAFVWLAGRFFRNAEAGAGRRAMLRRLAGSALMLGALALALQ